MRIRVRPVAFVSFCTLAVILNTFAGLAGPLSSVLAVLLPSLFACSMLQLALGAHFFTFHQTFSNDHPLKGEIVRYELHTANEGFIPLPRGECRFAAQGQSTSLGDSVPVPVAGNSSRVHTADIRCAYRGTYVIGLSLFGFTDALGLLRLEEKIEPRVFYVYPELVKLAAGIERFARSSGADQPGSDEKDEDPTIFEYLRPLRGGGSARRIAWKRWAASGIPSETVNGQARSASLRLVLDLWPGRQLRPSGETVTDKLASEDMAVSAVFSVLRHLSSAGIPVELVLGAAEKGIMVDSSEDFTELFDQSTNIIFSDPAFPAAAFTPGSSTLLVTTRPLAGTGAECGGESIDLFTAFENALPRGCEPHLLLCPPPSTADAEKQGLETLVERQSTRGGKALLRLADSRQGTEDAARALST